MITLLTATSTWDSLLQLLGVSILFVGILAITVLTTKFVGGVKMGMTKNSNFKVIETFKVTQNKYLQLVQIGKRYFVIAVGKDEMNVVAELQESDVTIIKTDKQQGYNFKEIIQAAMTKSKDKNKEDDQS
ncbi:hypothetical protein acsn021_28020 [Anaerocolumna cellulosilytica]|uniref:Uncharacterized protein n=1 Tax=Anaerocolumna cellulosilytica TaxID=433286 RepID=A0A6S6QVF5_9FIRM|nr:flagellar biosynthetic protein FliO [Anaerocolumna cellulosilytica]MBB5197019.1 flagellar protein FliO/FliZ [Anaerocolumna cellulosilytica]BCJ95233.1 hypothetical protein acsn021_28020 [Anaerocolumna cellulosilytica]